MGYLLAFSIGFIVGGFIMLAFTDNDDYHSEMR